MQRQRQPRVERYESLYQLWTGTLWPNLYKPYYLTEEDRKKYPGACRDYLDHDIHYRYTKHRLAFEQTGSESEKWMMEGYVTETNPPDMLKIKPRGSPNWLCYYVAFMFSLIVITTIILAVCLLGV